LMASCLSWTWAVVWAFLVSSPFLAKVFCDLSKLDKHYLFSLITWARFRFRFSLSSHRLEIFRLSSSKFLSENTQFFRSETHWAWASASSIWLTAALLLGLDLQRLPLALARVVRMRSRSCRAVLGGKLVFGHGQNYFCVFFVWLLSRLVLLFFREVRLTF
jgi:hypothetical protein